MENSLEPGQFELRQPSPLAEQALGGVDHSLGAGEHLAHGRSALMRSPLCRSVTSVVDFKAASAAMVESFWARPL